MTAEALSCQELVELVTEYLEGSLDPDLHERFEEHVGKCGGCATYLEQLRETIRVVGTLTPESIPPAAERELLDAFRTWKAG